MSPLRVLRGFVFGALGGILGWVFVELLPLPYPFQPGRYEAPGAASPSVTPEMEALLGLALGLAIGAFLGLSEGMSEGTVGRFRRAFLTFLVLGPVGGYIGLFFGQHLYGLLGGKADTGQLSAGEFFPQLLARSLGWTLIGLFLGITLGVPGLSVRRMWNGAIGGAIGGFLGGFVFQVLAFTRLFQGPQVRFLGFTIIGAAIGFFINLIAEAMKRVWVKVLIGRNEGREHVLDTPLAYVGRDELAEVPVFLDPLVPKRMASFRLTGNRYGLYPESSALPILVNGQMLQPGQVLRDGDAVQFGRVTLAYFEKATATGMDRPVDRIALADFGAASGAPGATPIPKMPGVCEFCGERKDPATGACACAVPAGGAYPAPGTYAPDPGAYPQSAPGGYAPAPGYGAGGDPYAATMMDPGQMPGYGVPGAGGSARLVAIGGPCAGQVFPLSGAELGIGRDPAQEISLSSDGAASRRHARLLPANGAWILRDEGSSNGTWINGVRIHEQALFPGDTVTIGGSQFRFEM